MKLEISPAACRLAGSYIEACVLGEAEHVKAIYEQAQPLWDEFVIAGLWLASAVAAEQGHAVPSLPALVADPNREAKMKHLIWKVIGVNLGIALKVGKIKRGQIAAEALRGHTDWDPSKEATSTDAQTAVAVLLHHTNNDARAIDQLVADAVKAGRADGLVYALAEFWSNTNPDYATEEGQDRLRQLILDLASDTSETNEESTEPEASADLPQPGTTNKEPLS